MNDDGKNRSSGMASEESDKIEGYESPTPGGLDGYPIDELAIRDERRTAEDVVRRIENNRFVLDPDFQRDFVWDKGKQSRLIESIFLRIPLPVFYVAEDVAGKLIVVDGQQRLTTLQRFLSGKLVLFLPERADLHKKRFSNLDARLQNRVQDCQLHFYIIDHNAPDRARLDIFERVNGGEVLTRQQMRNALYNGPATEFLRAQASTELFIEVTGKSLNTKKMRDREFVNRFCAFKIFSIKEYPDNMDEWLAEGLKAMNKMEQVGLSNIQKAFERSLKNNRLVFGVHAFRKHQASNQRRSILNASLYDVMSIGLSNYDAAMVAGKKEEIRKAFYSLIADPIFERAITYGTNAVKAVNTRFDMAKKMFNEVFGT